METSFYRQYRTIIVGTYVCVGTALILWAFVVVFPSQTHAQYAATTTVSLTVCGDGIVSGQEFCDDSTNTGAYSASIAGRQCNPLCSAWGPYCGDIVIQTLHGEECDDGNNTAGDLCDVICQNEQDPVTEGGGGTGSGGGGGKGSGDDGIKDASDDGEIDFEGDTEVIIQGRAYPGATITILRDGEIVRVVESDGDAWFDHTLTDQTPGITTLGFWAEDSEGRRSITYSATFQIVQNAVTTLTGVLVPPTLVVVPEKADPGTTISFEGSSVPGAVVHTYVDQQEQSEETLAAANGAWIIAYDTTPLGIEEFHTVKAHYIDPDNDELKSGFSQLTSFYVGVRDVTVGITADLNHDGFVNLTDFSILLFHWNSTNPVADINQDSLVSLADFSIMLFYWTG